MSTEEEVEYLHRCINPRRNGNGALRGLKQRERGAVEAIGVSETQKIPVVFFCWEWREDDRITLIFH